MVLAIGLWPDRRVHHGIRYEEGGKGKSAFEIATQRDSELIFARVQLYRGN